MNSPISHHLEQYVPYRIIVRVFLAIVLASMSFFMSAPTAFAEIGSTPIDMTLNPFLTLFPELKTAPAPIWLKTGKRWTYYYQYAGKFDPDVNTPTSGSGYFQFDLVALTTKNSVASLKTYLNNGKNYLIPTSAVASVQLPGLGEFWLAPSALVHAEDVANPDLTVTRMPKKVGNKTYQCVRFQSTSDDNSAEYVWMFEETTGKLIYYSYRIGDPTAPDQLGQIGLTKERTLPLPWKGTQARPWVTATKPWSLRYIGTQKIEYLNNPSPIYLYYRTDLARTRYQKSWGEYKATDYLYTNQTGWVQQGSIYSVTGTAQLFDLLWLPPEAFSPAKRWALNQPVKLDTDPITHATMFGMRISNNGIALREQGTETAIGPIYQTAMYYRQNDGKLTKIVRTDITDLLTTFMIKTIDLDLQQ